VSQDFAKRNNYPPGNSAQFGKDLKAYRHEIEKPRLRVDGRRVQVYRGISLRRR
jgi:hypothetical protein